MRILLITEKPDACTRIAKALDPEAARRNVSTMPYWQARVNGNDVILASGLGHLYTLTARERGYPVWTYDWRPRAAVEKMPARLRDLHHTYMHGLKALDMDIDMYVNACDYDIEGSLIGFTLLHHLLGNRERQAKRMCFSTLMPQELREAYGNLRPLDIENVEAGLARHEVDFLYGINVSRALMRSVASAVGASSVLSAGRVQTVALKWVVDLERRIRNHLPLPSWLLHGAVEVGGVVTAAEYMAGILVNLSEAESIQRACSGTEGVVEQVDKRVRFVQPPPPFKLATLQSEAYDHLGLTPDRSLSIAEKLYLDALISYPRTGSEAFPDLDYEGLLRGLRRIPDFSELVDDLLAKPLTEPVTGEGVDRAHPCIYATGKVPDRSLSHDEWSLYELICRRTISCFADPARLYHVTAALKCAEHLWRVKGLEVVDRGFYRYYDYSVPRETQLPPLEDGEKVTFLRVDLDERLTKPPSRLTPGSLLSKMEGSGIGTPATRAQIVKTLERRRYVSGRQYAATDLGFAVADTINGYCPELTSADMTRELEQKLEAILDRRSTRAAIVVETKRRLESILLKIKKNERAIGLALAGRSAKSCKLCGREAYPGDLCVDHERAAGGLGECLREWAARYGGRLTDDEILERLHSADETGAWVRDFLSEKT